MQARNEEFEDGYTENIQDEGVCLQNRERIECHHRDDHIFKLGMKILGSEGAGEWIEGDSLWQRNWGDVCEVGETRRRWRNWDLLDLPILSIWRGLYVENVVVGASSIEEDRGVDVSVKSMDIGERIEKIDFMEGNNQVVIITIYKL